MIQPLAVAANRPGLTQVLEAMDSSQLLTKAFLVLALVCAISVVILFSIASSGFLAMLLVYAFLVGSIASIIATALSSRSDSPGALQYMCRAALGAYTLTAASVILWVVVAKPPFG